MALFAQYAVKASSEALLDAGWKPTKQEDLEATVRVPYCSKDGSKYSSGRVHGFRNRCFRGCLLYFCSL